ncbi:MAG: SRPBCC family protein [Nitrososphaerales archaeon]
MHVEVSHVVKAQREKVYAAYADFEAWPKWSRQATTVRVVGREGDTVSIESEIVSGGRPRITAAKLTLSPPEGVETEGETRLTRTRRTVRFEDVPEGTRVTAVLDLRVKGAWAWIFATRGKDEAESFAQEGLRSFAEYVESLP